MRKYNRAKNKKNNIEGIRNKQSFKRRFSGNKYENYFQPNFIRESQRKEIDDRKKRQSTSLHIPDEDTLIYNLVL